MSDDGDTSLVPMATMFPNATVKTIQGGTFVAGQFVNYNIQPKEHQTALQILHQCVALGAFHDAALRGDPPRCHPRTREAILKKIMVWVEQRPENLALFFLWMYGPAGAGKTAIAQTIAELCAEANLLAASFFFSRTAAGRNDNSRLVATLTWQLIQSIPEIREYVLTSLERDPTIISRAPAAQMKALIIDSLNMVSKEVLNQRPRFIIIDGLDECLDRPSQENILKLLAQSIRQINAPIQVLIASRPELEIRDTFRSDVLHHITLTLPLEHDHQSDEDIRHFLTSKFQELHSRRPHLPQSWPPKADIEALVEKSSGQFIYAATVIRYIESRRHQPKDRLKAVLEIRSSETDTPFGALDALYLQIFSSVENDQLDNVMKFLGALILIKSDNPDELGDLEDLFGYQHGQLEVVMGDMVALVNIPTERSHPVKIYHASLPDFLLDPFRSREFFLDRRRVCANLALYCLRFNRERWDSRHLARTLDCIIQSDPSSELVDMLLDFNPWQMGSDPKFRLVPTPAFFQWLKESSSSPQCIELFRVQFHNFDKWALEALREMPADYQTFVPAAICIHSSFILNSPTGNGITLILSPVMSRKGPLGYFFMGENDFPTEDIKPCSSYLSELLNDAARAAEFLVTERHFTNFALHCAKLAFGVVPRPAGVYVSVTLECILLSLPLSSRSTELVQLLRCHALQPSSPDDSPPLRQKREETAKECLKYIERCEALDSRRHPPDGDRRGVPELKGHRGLRHRLHQLKMRILR